MERALDVGRVLLQRIGDARGGGNERTLGISASCFSVP
jgi:hypothetical protein